MSRFSDKVKKNGKKCTFCDISMSNIGLVVDHIGVQHDQVEIQEIALSLFALNLIAKLKYSHYAGRLGISQLYH